MLYCILIIDKPMKQYFHFSYDVENVTQRIEQEVGDSKPYDTAKRFLLCVVKQTKPHKITSYVGSTLILEYEVDDEMKDFAFKLDAYLKQELSNYFNYVLSRIWVGKRHENNKNVLFLFSNPDTNLNTDFQKLYANLNCVFKNLTVNKFSPQ